MKNDDAEQVAGGSYKVTWKRLFVDMLGAAINFDSKFIRTFNGLLLHPGKTLRAIIDDGDPEDRYANPMSFVFFLGALYVIATILFPDQERVPYIPVDHDNLWQKLFAYIVVISNM